MTLGEWHRHIIKELNKIYSTNEAKSIARLVFEDVLDIAPVDFFLKSTTDANKATNNKLEQILKRLLQHEPVQYITGTAHFYGLKFKVNPNVLIPRPETEELVKWIETDLKGKANSLRILDIGTGSGCIAIALKKIIAGATIHAIDISGGALEVAHENALVNDVEVIFFKDDILNSKNNERYDVIVSNPPYIKTSEQNTILPNVLNYEPHTALFTDEPLLFYKAISQFALKHLNLNGFLYFEINEQCGNDVIQLMQQSGFSNAILKQDMNHKDRMVRCSI